MILFSIKRIVGNYTFFDLLTIYYKLETEEKTETLLYDAVNFLSAAGGAWPCPSGRTCSPATGRWEVTCLQCKPGTNSIQLQTPVRNRYGQYN